jgi:hypothetical protein
MDRVLPLALVIGSSLACSSGGVRLPSLCLDAGDPGCPADDGALPGPIDGSLGDDGGPLQGDADRDPDAQPREDGSLEDATNVDAPFDAPADASRPPATTPRTCAEAAAAPSHYGCEFWPTISPNNVWTIFDFGVVIVNPGTSPASIQVTSADGFSARSTIPAGGRDVMILPWRAGAKGPDTDACGEVKPLPGSIRVTGAYKLVADRPVSVTQYSPLQPVGGGAGKDWSSCPGNQTCSTLNPPGPIGCNAFSADASVLLPTTSLGTRYRVTTVPGWDQTQILGPAREIAPGVVTITGTANGTAVTVTSSARIIAGGDLPAVTPGEPFTFALGAHETVTLVSESKASSDLSGSLIEATRSVQVIGGAPCVTAPIGTAACDHVETTVLPLDRWGRTHVLPTPMGPRSKKVGRLVRLVGDGPTTLRWSPTKPAGAPDTLAARQVVQFESDANLVVSGDRAFGVAIVHVGGGKVDPGSTGSPIGDPALSVAVPTERWRNEYVFVVPTGWSPVTLDLVRPVGGSITLDGTALGSAEETIDGQWEIVRASVPADGAVHVLRGSALFGGQIVGYAPNAAIALPLGVDLR